MALTLPLDLAMASPATNRVVDEPHLIDTAESRFFVPQGGPFFALGIELKIGATLLMPGVHYQILHMYEEATLASGKEVDAIVYIKDTPLTPLGSTVLLTCHYVGGPYSATTDALQQILDNLALPGAEMLGWGSVLNKPVQYPPAAHLHHVRNLFGTDEMVTVLEGVRQAILQGDQGTINAIHQYIDAKIAQLGNAMAAAYATTQAIQAAITAHQAASNAHTKSSVGLGSVGNYPMADETQAKAGTAWNLYMSPAGVAAYIGSSLSKALLTEARQGTDDAKMMTSLKVALAVRNGYGNGGVAEDPNATLTPVIFVNSNAYASLSALPRNRIYRIETYFRSLVGDTITTASVRRQEAYDADGGVVWVRDFDGTNWSAWNIRSLDLLQNVYNNINDGVIASYQDGASHFDVNSGLIAGHTATPRSTTVGGVTTVHTPEYHLFLGKVGEHAFRGIAGSIDPIADAYFDTICVRPNMFPDAGYVNLEKMKIVSYDPGLTNSPVTLLQLWKNNSVSHAAGGSTVHTVLQAGTVRLGPTKSANLRRLIRVAGAFAIADFTVQKDPGRSRLGSSESFAKRLASLGSGRRDGISIMLVLSNMVTERERRVMFLRTQSAATPNDIRLGVGIAVGALPAVMGDDVLLDDAAIISSSTPIATQYTSTINMPRLLTDSTAMFHGLVESTSSAVGLCNVRVFRPHWSGSNSAGENALSSVATASISFSMLHYENVVAMCMFESPTKPTGFIINQAHALIAILTTIGRLKIWRVVTDATNPPTFTEVADILLYNYVPANAIASSDRMCYVGGCFHIRRGLTDGSYIIPWVTAFGNTLPLPIRESHHSTLPIVSGNNYYAIGEAQAVRMGRINFTDDEFF